MIGVVATPAGLSGGVSVSKDGIRILFAFYRGEQRIEGVYDSRGSRRDSQWPTLLLPAAGKLRDSQISHYL